MVVQLGARPSGGLVDQQERLVVGVEGAWIAGVDITAARTGYTGEDGFELFVPAEVAAPVWQALLAAGAAPIGLGALLRLFAFEPLSEIGLGPLHLHAIARRLGVRVTERQRHPGIAFRADASQFLQRNFAKLGPNFAVDLCGFRVVLLSDLVSIREYFKQPGWCCCGCWFCLLASVGSRKLRCVRATVRRICFVLVRQFVRHWIRRRARL